MNLGSCPGAIPCLGGYNTLCARVMAGIPQEMLYMDKCEPFVRLMSTPTTNYIVKRIDMNLCAPKDSLDLALSACYDQHRQFWAPKAQTVMQCATYRLFPWGRCQEKLAVMRCMLNQPCPGQGEGSDYYDASNSMISSSYSSNESQKRRLGKKMNKGVCG